MTDEEALKLRNGDEVEVLVKSSGNHHWSPAVVVTVHENKAMAERFRVEFSGYQGRCVTVKVRRQTHVSTNYEHRQPSDVRLPLTSADPVPANVYADFLEEQGESRAAALLREHFPLGAVVN